MTDRRGIPLVAGVTGAERPDEGVFEALIDAIPPVKGRRGRPRRRPGKLHADKGDDVRHCRRYLRRRGLRCRIARKGVEDKARLGRHRWVIARTLAWLHRDKRRRVREERSAAIPQALLDLGCALLCFKRVQALRPRRE